MVGDDLYGYAKSVKSREDFIKFVEYLNEDYGQQQGQWENLTLGSYLSGLSAFATDMDGYYKNMGETVNVETITWRMAAEMLLAATVYGG
jgi:hypothetical protein